MSPLTSRISKSCLDEMLGVMKPPFTGLRLCSVVFSKSINFSLCISRYETDILILNPFTFSSFVCMNSHSIDLGIIPILSGSVASSNTAECNRNRLLLEFDAPVTFRKDSFAIAHKSYPSIEKVLPVPL